MPSAVRSYLTMGVALMGAGFVTAAQITPPLQQAETRVVQAAITLAAAVGNGLPCSGYNTEGCDINAPQTYVPQVLDQSGNAANIAANVVNLVVSMPRAFIDAVNELSYALEVTGNWWVYSPTNVLGFDPADPPKITALVDLMIPFKPVSHAVGEHLSWWGKANLPMDEGCTADVGPLCGNIDAIFAKMFLAPIWTLAAGYQFPEVVNPVSDAEGAYGNQIPGSTGTETAWSKAFVKLNLFDPAIALMNYLTADPAANAPKPITPGEIVATLDRLRKALVLDFNPFVQNSFLLKGWPYTALTPLFKPFVPILCPTCDPVNPGGPTAAVPAPQSAAATLVSAQTPADSSTSGTPAVDVPGDEQPAGAEPGSAKPDKAPSADVRAAVADATETPAATDSTDAGQVTAGPAKKADDATDASDSAPSAPVGKHTRGSHVGGRTSASAGTAGDQGGNPAKAGARSAASAE